MDFLFSNFPPLKTKKQSFYESFYNNFGKASEIDLAVGYITADSLTTLKRFIELSDPRKLNLIIGMHHFEMFTRLEYLAAIDLNSFLKKNSLGEVYLVTAFKYHGKLYSYSKNGIPFAGIIGSNNLSSIIDKNARIYDASVLINEAKKAMEIKEFIYELKKSSCRSIDTLEINEFREQNKSLENIDYVKKLRHEEITNCLTKLTDITFSLPIKTERKSNLNAFFGKGRKSKNGLIKPRPWYEVEIIVDHNITSSKDYPKANTPEATFDVITDDGWKFKCNISGSNSKNFRSENDLKILGRWIKGRMENAGVLNTGEYITEKTLKEYGRNSIKLTKTSIPNLWYLDFGVKL